MNSTFALANAPDQPFFEEVEKPLFASRILI